MTVDVLEQDVVAALQDSLKHHRALDRLADQMLAEGASIDYLDEAACQMTRECESIAVLDRKTSELKIRYRESRNQPSSKVAELTNTLATQMQTVLFKISQLEQRANQTRSALLPQIHDNVRALQMRSAYGKNS